MRPPTPPADPIQGAAWKSAPALACGNAMLFKPAEDTPLTALRLAEVYREAGLPEGLFSVLLGDATTGQALTSHPDIAKVSFTGGHWLWALAAGAGPM